LSEIVESFQPLGASPDFTTELDAEYARYLVMCPCPLKSYTSCSKTQLTYYYMYISSMQL